MDGIVREGFICSVCKLEFSSPEILLKHFHVHTEPVKNQGNNYQPSNDKHFLPISFNQTSRTSEFKNLRFKSQAHINYQTNNLILILEKLLKYDSETNKCRRSYEESIVEWIGQEAKQCPFCGFDFGIGKTRVESTSIIDQVLDYGIVYKKRHHCRLCGYILCGSCSYLLKESHAMEILEAMKKNSADFSLRNEFETFLVSNPKNLAHRGSETPSENGSTSRELTRRFTKEYELRICGHCLGIINRKYMASLTSKDDYLFVSSYNTMRKSIDLIKMKLEQLNEIIASLRLGEDKYNLEAARTLREETIELFNDNQIAFAEIGKIRDEMDKEANPRLYKLITKILQFNHEFLKVHFSSVKTLPTIEEYHDLQSKNKYDVELKWSKLDELNKAGVVVEEKFVAKESVDKEFIQCLILQIENVKGYLESARREGRGQDEIKSLEENLKMLQLTLENERN